MSLRNKKEGGCKGKKVIYSTQNWQLQNKPPVELLVICLSYYYTLNNCQKTVAPRRAYLPNLIWACRPNHTNQQQNRFTNPGRKKWSTTITKSA